LRVWELRVERAREESKKLKADMGLWDHSRINAERLKG
jgi:hypothetical protein